MSMNLAKFLNKQAKPPWLVYRTAQGVFVRESDAQNLVSQYAKAERVYRREALRHLKDECISPTNDNLVYFVMSNGCEVGYLFEHAVLSPNLLDKTFPMVEGDVLSCRDHLYIGDPRYVNNSTIRLRDSNPVIAEFLSSDPPLKIHEHAFDRFYQRARQSPSLHMYDQRRKSTKRDCLRILYQEMSAAEPVKRRNTIQQLMKHEFREARYLTRNNWIYVVEEGGLLRTCYDKGEVSSATGYR